MRKCLQSFQLVKRQLVREPVRNLPRVLNHARSNKDPVMNKTYFLLGYRLSVNYMLQLKNKHQHNAKPDMNISCLENKPKFRFLVSMLILDS